MRLGLLILVLSVATAAADNRSEAILLFDQGVKEMKAGDFEKACNSFERSLAAYADSGTKGSLAKCYEKSGKLASSWLLWRELADLAPSSDLRRDAAAQAAKLEPRVAHYVIKVTKSTPGMEITINGRPAKALDLPVPIDAGAVIVRAFATGRKDWSNELTVKDGDTLKLEIPELEVVKIDTPHDPGKGVVMTPPPPTKGSKRKPVGFALVGVGAVGLAVGTVFGLKAKSKFADAKDTCGGSIDQCNPADVAGAQTQVDDARSAGNLSSLAFVLGGAAIAGGVFLVVTAPKKEHVTMTATPLNGGAAAVLSGRF
jgi:hypothetical protein